MDPEFSSNWRLIYQFPVNERQPTKKAEAQGQLLKFGSNTNVSSQGI
jgi:hypothetical protein